MDRLRPEYLSRQQLQAFLGERPDLVKAFEVFVRALSTDMPDELAELQLGATTTVAALAALTQAQDNDRRDAEAARMLALSAQVEQLREQAITADDATLLSLAAQIAQIREDITAGNYGMKRKQTVYNNIVIGAGVASNTYTLSPAVASISACDLENLGVTATAAAGITDAAVALEFTNTTTITARRIGTAGTVTVYFKMTEFTQ